MVFGASTKIVLAFFIENIFKIILFVCKTFTYCIIKRQSKRMLKQQVFRKDNYERFIDDLSVYVKHENGKASVIDCIRLELMDEVIMEITPEELSEKISTDYKVFFKDDLGDISEDYDATIVNWESEKNIIKINDLINIYFD